MIVHLVKNHQLKKPVKRLAPTSDVLVQLDGTIVEPMYASAYNTTAMKGQPIASFEIGQKELVHTMVATALGFNELFKYLSTHFAPTVGADVVYRIWSSQSLTIALVTGQLNVPRASAKEFIERCVRCGAYKKYYSYWVRTDVFTSWLAHQDGG